MGVKDGSVFSVIANPQLACLCTLDRGHRCCQKTLDHRPRDMQGVPSVLARQRGAEGDGSRWWNAREERDTAG